MKCYLLAILLFTKVAFCAWTSPFTISPNQSSLNPAGYPLAIDRDSNAIVGWLDGPAVGATGPLLSSVLPGGTTIWESPDQIFQATPPQFSAFPLMFTDIFDSQIAAFGVIDIVNNNIEINTSRRPFGATTWPAPASITLAGISAAGSAQAGNRGNVMAVLPMTPNFSPPFAITLITMPTNAPFNPPVVLDQDNSTTPVVGSTVNEGRGVGVWKTNIPTLTLKGIRYMFSTNQIVPLSNVPLPAGTTDVTGVQITSDINGNTVLFFTAEIGGIGRAYASILSLQSTSWTTPILLSNSANNSIALSTHLSDQNIAGLLWSELTPGNQGFIFAADLNLNGQVSSKTQLAGPFNAPTAIDLSSNINLDTFGNAVAIWGVTAGGVSTIQVEQKSLGGSWAQRTTLSNSGTTPKVVLSDQGTAVAIWLEVGSLNLLGSTNLAIFPLQPPTNFVGTLTRNRFINISDFLLQATFVPTPELNIVRYEIRQNGVLVATIPPGGPFVFTHTFCSQPINLNFTLTSIASNGNQSPPVPLVIR